MKNDFNIIIVNETLIGYKKDLEEYIKSEVNRLINEDLENENGIDNLLGTLRYLIKYNDFDLLKISECAMDIYGIKIDILESE